MLSWHFFKRSSRNSDCDFAQSALTAAFDGEADDAQLLRARDHRACCSRCRLLWSQWEKTSVLLRAAPAPMAPAALREQILVTCRALPIADFCESQNELLQTQKVLSRDDLIAYLDAPSEEFSVARLQSFATDIAPPPTLSRQILERTTRAEKSARVGFLSALRAAFGTGSTPARARVAARWGFGLAAPALAAWLIFSTQTSLTETPASINKIISSVETNPISNPKPAAAKPQTQNNVLPSIKKVAPKIAVLPDTLKTQTEKMPAIKTPAPKQSETISPRGVAVSLDFPAPKKKNPVSENSLSKKPRAQTSLKPQFLATPLVDKTVSSQAKLSRVALSPSTSRAPLAATHRFNRSAAPRISSPALPTAGASATRFADARFADDDFDAALSAIALQRDNRPEDLGRALDEYSASLLAENSSENDDDGWG